ncbi:MAG: hypothetical protein QM811_01955 [Pirellulales bacterium]
MRSRYQIAAYALPTLIALVCAGVGIDFWFAPRHYAGPLTQMHTEVPWVPVILRRWKIRPERIEYSYVNTLTSRRYGPCVLRFDGRRLAMEADGMETALLPDPLERFQPARGDGSPFDGIPDGREWVVAIYFQPGTFGQFFVTDRDRIFKTEAGGICGDFFFTPIAASDLPTPELAAKIRSDIAARRDHAREELAQRDSQRVTWTSDHPGTPIP